jgi:hypothetical protein
MGSVVFLRVRGDILTLPAGIQRVSQCLLSNVSRYSFRFITLRQRFPRVLHLRLIIALVVAIRPLSQGGHDGRRS